MDARRTAVLILTGFALGAGGFAVGRVTDDDITWHTGTAILGGDASHPQFSSVFGDWIYGASDGIPHWVDAAGKGHSGGWPNCLVPPTEAHPERDQVVPVRFGTVPVDGGDGVGGRVVVAVDCR